MKLVQLKVGLFPDAQTVEAALRRLAATHRVEAVDLTRRDMQQSDWDEAIRLILAADLIVSS
jgi:hypothetical protein